LGGSAGFGRRLRLVTARRGPLCVGIDPHPGLLDVWGLSHDHVGLERFCLTVVEALADRVAVLKPQSAFFEAYGSRGVAVLERVSAEARAAGALVLLDVKRGDIGSTMAAYAAAYLGADSPFACDAVTLSPYLGVGALDQAIDTALRSGRGVFVLAMTSNPEGAQVQRAGTADGRPVAQLVVDAARERNTGGPGSVGVVIGATVGEHGLRLDGLNGPILVPGLGAQGAGAADLPRVFGTALSHVLPTISRGVLGRGPSIGALRAAAAEAVAELAAILR
jgi:orotidine-5'-phosphate decarboxylase